MITIISDGYLKENKILKKVLKNKLTICYIPAWHSSEEVLKDFKKFKKIFNQYECLMCNIDIKQDHAQIINSCDIVFIDGGNTFFLLKYLKKNRLKRVLKKKDIIAKSAGAIALSPSIVTAKYPLENADDDYYQTKSLQGLNLINFKVYPHYEGIDFENEFLKKQDNILIMKDGQYYNTSTKVQ